MRVRRTATTVIRPAVRHVGAWVVTALILSACSARPAGMDAAADEVGVLDSPGLRSDAPADAPSDAPPGPDAPIPSVATLDEYFTLWPLVACDAWDRCGQLYSWFLYAIGARACEDWVRATLDNADMRRLVREGLVMYDGTAASACLALWASPSCELGATDASPCGDIFRGATADGEPCLDSRQCAPGTQCSGDAPSVTCGVAGTCCDDMGVCAPRLPLGAACTGDLFECSVGTVCSGGVCTELTVAARLGEPCDASTACVPLLRCHENVCTDPRSLLRSAGEPCDDLDRCEAGLVCTSAGCIAPRPLGAPCAGDGSHPDCVPEAYCDAFTCAPRVPIGGTCAATECVGGAFCSSTTHRCVERVHLGGACTTDEECFSTRCREGMCELGRVCL